MTGFITSPTPQFVDPLFGEKLINAEIYIGIAGTDAFAQKNRKSVYLMQYTEETRKYTKVELPQPLQTNDAGVIVYNGLPVTPWVDDAYSITIIGYAGVVQYSSMYVDDPTYWLRIDLATEPRKTSDGLHYDATDPHGVNLVAGAAPILSPDFKGAPTSPTPPAGDSSTRIATTEFVQAQLTDVHAKGVIGTMMHWPGTTAPANAVVRDGSQLSKSKYPELYAIIGDSVAIANGLVPDSASFYIPDARSRYDRGTDNGASRSGYAQHMKNYGDMFKAHSHPQNSGTLYAPPNKSGANQVQSDDSDIMVNFGGNTDSVGGGETMPMTTTSLPIIWVTTSNSTSETWWSSSTLQSPRPTVHHYDETTGEHVASSLAQPSPAEPGVWLTPLHATQDTPPASKPGHIIAWRSGQWLHDAELFQQRQQQREEERLTRERQNQQLMITNQKREAMNAWLLQQGAPFTIDDLLDDKQ